MWLAEIFELGVSPLTLSDYLNRLRVDGWDVRFMMPNGVNRWTIVCWRQV